MAEDRWTRRCNECGWIDPAASYSSKEPVELKVYAEYDGKLEHHAPRCTNCGSLDIEAILVSDPPEPRSAGVA